MLDSVGMSTRKFLIALVIVSSWADLAPGQSDNAMQPACQNIALQPLNRSFTAEGGNTLINVYHESGCSFTASSSDQWIHVTSVIAGDTIGTVYYSVAPYSGAGPRSGAITVGLRSFPVYQINDPFQKAPSILSTRADHGGSVNAVAFSPDGQFLASGSNDRTVKVWRVAGGARSEERRVGEE